MDTIEKELGSARHALLDLTMRNRLLNFKPSRNRTVQVIDEIPSQIYDRLVIQEKKMEFRPGVISSEHLVSDDDDERALLWQMPQERPDPRNTDRYLQTSLKSEDLQKKLRYISQQSRSVFEEQGYTVLYLALGFMEWNENDLKPVRSPLILVPVELQRLKVDTAFQLNWTGEDIFTNISLQAKLKEDGLSLPDFEMPEDREEVDAYYQSVAELIKDRDDWNVLSEIHLGFFSFTKFVMYKDLEPAAWPGDLSPAQHPLIKRLFDPQPHEPEPHFQENDVDIKLKARDIYHVMDADPSQIAVIEDVKSGRSMVVEGPPGTGKSQTITNIIAELLAAGKSVLFVSEKMAALEVVKGRLDKVGLGDHCLELHSRKSNKKAFLKELERTLSLSPPRAISSKDQFERLETLKNELNGYAISLREPVGNTGLSPFDLFSMKEKSLRHFGKLRTIAIPEIEKCNEKQLHESISSLKALSDVLPLIQPVDRNPWKGCDPGIVLPQDENEIMDMLKEATQSLNSLIASLDKLCGFCSIHRSENIGDIGPVIRAAEIVRVSEPVDRQVLLNPEWNELSAPSLKLISDVQAMHKQREFLCSIFEEHAFEQDIKGIAAEYRHRSDRFFIARLFDGRYRSLKKQLTSFYKKELPSDLDSLMTDLNRLSQCIVLRESLQQRQQEGEGLFGSHWKGEHSDPVALKAFADWMVSFREKVLADVFEEKIIDEVSSGISGESIEKAILEVRQGLEDFKQVHDRLFVRIGSRPEAVFGMGMEEVPFDQLFIQYENWRTSIPDLQKWSQFMLRKKDCCGTYAAFMVNPEEMDELSPDDLIPFFKASVAESLLHLAFRQCPSLSGFMGKLHEKKIKEFTALDNDLILKNRQRLARLLYEKQPRIPAGASPNSEAGILLGEFNRKRRHMPIRKLMKKAGGLIQQIKPCFMMSPLSIALFLDPLNIRFDVVIFDEASQVKPEDALGSLLRAGQCVVIGDSRQLPPTSFFDRIVDASDEVEEDISTPFSDIESILHMCRRTFLVKDLRWHYRSRHESLIAVSNQEFYDNKLLIYPSPMVDIDHLGLKFVHLPDTVYDRGKSSVNRLEARAVAQATVEQLRNDPDKSLGIGTFNLKQQQAILDEIDILISKDPGLNDLFDNKEHEPFFVKNLETIQGDERDVILISVGFGFDRDGKLNQNFGPLNKDGGQRRLNVLITRAREKCVVFSNFRAKDLRVDQTSPFGLRSLKVFLDFAENRTLISCEPTGEDSDSPFEDSVYDFLIDEGYQVHKQVGCAGYRLDLGLVDPASPGRYLLGIECDGASYHSSAVARDRDRLRQQVLEGLGWRIYRVWSTDWYRNRSDCQNRLCEAIEKARSHPVSPPKKVDVMDYSVERETITCDRDIPKLSAKIAEYRQCSRIDIDTSIALHDLSLEQMEKGILSVLEVESPIHINELIARIRANHGLNRTGSRIKKSIGDAVEYSVSKKHLLTKGPFLYLPGREVQVRRRSSAKIDQICDEEIEKAVCMVLEEQHATTQDELIICAARLIGFQARSKGISKRIGDIMANMLQQNRLHTLSGDMVDLVR